MYKAVLFDFDGIILQSAGTHARIWKEILLNEFDLEIDARDIYLDEGRPTTDIALSIFKKYNLEISHEEAHRIAEKKQAAYFNAKTPDFYPEAPGVVEYLKEKGILTAVVTGTRRANIDRVLTPHIKGLFNDFITAERYTNGKPHPEPFLNGAKHLGVDPQESIVVENAPLGVRAAKAAGAHVIAVCTTLSAEDLHEADEILPDFHALQVRFRELFD
ncbi:MAG: HAD family phosphatase [Calditrichaeota bacterium]|nr:MAG: HAD family phosphatase [Calditrichota bacterium]